MVFNFSVMQRCCLIDTQEDDYLVILDPLSEKVRQLRGGTGEYTTKYVADGFVYRTKYLSRGKFPIRYLGCAEYTRLGCKARAALPRSGDIRQIRINIPHNHPPDVNAAEKSAFLSKLKDAVNIIPGPLRAVYKGIAELYPNAAKELTYNALSPRMRRWRKNYAL